jgi:hypothetical protein
VHHIIFPVIVRLVDDILPHASTDVHVLVCDVLQVPVAAGVFAVAVTTPSQRSLAVAEPNAASMPLHLDYSQGLHCLLLIHLL